MQQLELANKASFIVTNSVTLYFDLESLFNQNQIDRDFYNLLGAIEQLMKKSEENIQHYQKAIDTDLQPMAFKIFVDSERQLNELMRHISASYGLFNNQLLMLISQIINETNKFDY